MTVYVNENFDAVTPPALPSGWSSSVGAGGSVATSATQSSSSPNSLKFAGATVTGFAFAGKYGTTDSNNGNVQAEAKFLATSISGSTQTYGLWLRASVSPSGTTLPGNAFCFRSSMVSGGTHALTYTDSGGTETTIQTNGNAVTYSAGAWYRVILVVQETLDTSVYTLTAYVYDVTNAKWLLPSGSWGTANDVQTPFMSVTTGYSFGTGAGTGLGRRAYQSAWASGTQAGVVCRLATGESMYADDFVFSDSPAASAATPSSPPVAGNEVELLPSATAISDAGRASHTASNVNVSDTDFTSYYVSANTAGSGSGEYVRLDAGSGNAVSPTALIWSPAYGADGDLSLGGLELYAVGMILEGANSTSGPWTQIGVTSSAAFPRVQALATQRLDSTSPGGTYRYFRLRSPLTTCAVNQFRLVCTTATVGSALCRPTRPTFSPDAGRFASGQAVAITSNTGTVAGQATSIYYTVGTRSSPPADPTNASTLYTGQFVIASNAPDETVIKAIAYNTGCTTPTSAVSTGHFIAGPFRGSLQLKGSGGYASVPNASPLQLSGPCTIMCWVFAPAKQGNFCPMISKESGSGASSSYYLGLNNSTTNGQIYFGFNAGANEIDYTLSAGFYGAWHHVAGVFTGSGLILYVDGVNVLAGGNSTTQNVNTSALNLGAYTPSSVYLVATMADVAIFNSNIGATAIAAVAAGTASPGQYNPVAWWPMGEGGGATAFDRTTGGHDAAVNGTFVTNWAWATTGPPALSTELVTGSQAPNVFDAQTTGNTYYGNGSNNNWPADWYDTDGFPVSANNASCAYDPVTGLYWLIGGNMSSGEIINAGGLVYYRGHNWYSSADLSNWSFKGQLIANYSAATGSSTGGNVVDRLHLLVNPSPLDPNKKYVQWGNVGNLTAGYGGCWTAPAITGPYTFQTSVQPGGLLVADCNVFYDDVDDGTGHTRNKADFLWSEPLAPNRNIRLVQLDPATDWTSVTGGITTLATANSNGWPLHVIEAPVLLKQGGYYYLGCSAGVPYGSGNGANQYAAATTLAGLSSATSASIWASTPPTASVAYNAQMTGVIPVTGLSANAWIFLFDQQDAGDTASPVNMNNWKMCWLPVSTVTSGNAVNAFPSAGTFSLRMPSAWDASFLPGPPPGKIVSNVLLGSNRVGPVALRRRWRGPQVIISQIKLNSYVVTASASSFALAGGVAALTIARKLTGTVGVFTLTGGSAGTYYGHKITTSTGSFVLIGQSATILSTRKITVSAATFTLTGGSAALQATRSMTASEAAFTISALSAGLSYTPGAASILASPGSFSLTGSNSTLLYSKRMVVGSAQFSLTGGQAALTRTRIMTVSPAGFTLSGRPTVLTYSGTPTSPAFSITLGGNIQRSATVEAAVQRNVMLSADAGSNS